MRFILHVSHFAATAGRTEGLAFEERKTVYVKRKPCSVRHLRIGMTPGSHAQGAWSLQGWAHCTVVSPKESFVLIGRWVLVNTKDRRKVSTGRVKIVTLLASFTLSFGESALVSGSSWDAGRGDREEIAHLSPQTRKKKVVSNTVQIPP